MFYGHLTNALKIIPKKRISLTHKDKKWVTPLLKSLLTDRWNAFRCKNFEKYNHLKVKVKSEITKSKKLYHKKLISNGANALWSSIKQEAPVHNTFSFNFKGSDKDLAQTINDNLGNIMSTNGHFLLAILTTKR